MSFDKNNDLSVADHLIKKHDLMYYNQSFYEYENNYWRPVPINVVKNLILDELKELYKQSRVNNIIDIIQLQTGKKEDEINLHQKEKAININNGIFNWGTEILTPHGRNSMKLYATNLFPVDYSKSAKCTRWEQFVFEIFEKDGDKYEKVLLLQEFLGYCLTQDVSYQKALLLLGNGSNGKSIILQVLELILGKENYSNIELNQLSNKNYIIEILNKYLNICSEIDHKNQFSSGVFKRVVTGETITGDAKFKNPIKFHPYAKLIFATNDLPITSDTTKGYFRRLIILRFNRSFEGKNKNPNLFKELTAELDGIFIWMLEGLSRLNRNGKFTEVTSSNEEIQTYLETSNSVVSFINQKREITKDKRDHETYQGLYSDYKDYCNEYGSRPFSKLNFRNEIQKQFQGKISFSRSGDKRNHFSFIKLKNEDE